MTHQRTTNETIAAIAIQHVLKRFQAYGLYVAIGGPDYDVLTEALAALTETKVSFIREKFPPGGVRPPENDAPRLWTADHIDPDVFLGLEQLAGKLPLPLYTRGVFRQVLNHVLRVGLETAAMAPEQLELRL